MSNVPLMPMATAVWLVENTTLTFKQISKFCNLHEVEVQGIADGEVAKGIMAYNPIISGQLTREEIELASKDENKELQIKNTDIEISTEDKKIKKYIPLSKRQDKPDSALWLIKHHSLLKDSQIAKLVGVTKASVTSIKNTSPWAPLPIILPIFISAYWISFSAALWVPSHLTEGLNELPQASFCLSVFFSEQII